MDWDGWTMPRVVVAFVALAFTMMWIQVFLLHGRSAFHRREQYIPVLEAARPAAGARPSSGAEEGSTPSRWRPHPHGKTRPGRSPRLGLGG